MVTLGYMFACLLITVLVAALTWASDIITFNDDFVLPWMLSSFGFGVCLTILLYDHGILAML